MDDFKVGDEVVCVCHRNGGAQHPTVTALLVAAGQGGDWYGRHFFIRDLTPGCDGRPGIRLREIVLPPIMTTAGVMEVSWFADCFRKIDPKKIEIFRQMCSPENIERAKKEFS